MVRIRALVDGEIPGGTLHENSGAAQFLFDGCLRRTNVIRRELKRLRGEARWVAGEVHEHGEWFSRIVIEAHHGQRAITGLGLKLGVTVAIEAVYFRPPRGEFSGAH